MILLLVRDDVVVGLIKGSDDDVKASFAHYRGSGSGPSFRGFVLDGTAFDNHPLVALRPPDGPGLAAITAVAAELDPPA